MFFSTDKQMTQTVIEKIDKKNSLSELVNEVFSILSASKKSPKTINLQSTDKSICLAVERAESNKNHARSIHIEVSLKRSVQSINYLMQELVPYRNLNISYGHKKSIAYTGYISFRTPPKTTRVHSFSSLSKEEQELLKQILPQVGLDIKKTQAYGDQSSRTYLEVPPTDDYSEEKIVPAFLSYAGPLCWQIMAAPEFSLVLLLPFTEAKAPLYIRGDKDKVKAVRIYHSSTINGFKDKAYPRIQSELEVMAGVLNKFDWELVCPSDPGKWWEK